jgi:hypothetical protein
MQNIIASLVSALKRERTKNAELQQQLKTLQNQNRIVGCETPPMVTEQEATYYPPQVD